MEDIKLEKEKALERFALTIQEDRIAKDIKRQGLSGTPGGKTLIKKTLTNEESFIKFLDSWIENTQSKKGRKPSALKYIKILPTSTTSFLTARILVNAIAKKNRTYRSVVNGLASDVLIACGAHLYEMLDTDKFNKLVRTLNWQPKSYIREKIASETFIAETVHIDASDQEALAIGCTLVDLFCSHTGLFEVRQQWRNGCHSEKHIEPTDLGSQWIKDANFTNQVATPYHLPMVIPPAPWTTLHDGGYLYQNLHPACLVRTREKTLPETLENSDLSIVMKAVNTIQNTAWTINKPIWDVWIQCVGKGLAGCSDKKDVKVPDRIEPTESGFDKRQAQRREAFETIKDSQAKSCVEAQKLKMGKLLLEEEELYFPHNLDFRGRIYPLAGRGAINPQGDDSGKAMLKFAHGKELGEDGVPWLFIHAQNVWGNDKINLQSRIEATEKNLDEYCSYAMNPMVNRGWMEADKPFCFLACCFELLGYTMEGEDYVSHLPIAIDGSCNGLQHFAGIMLDQRTAEAVNVVQTNTEHSADIYTQVADGVEILLTKQAAEGIEEARYWVGKVRRDVVKQPVMTLSYGVTRIGMRDQIVDKCRKLVRKGKLEYQEGTNSSLAAYLAEQIHSVIGNVAGAAFDVMNWLASAASTKAQVIDDLDGAFSWVTPTGLPVVQEYFDYDTQRFKVFVEGRSVKFTQRIGPAQIKKSKQRQGAAPNFVHSLDASHLMLTVNECARHGIEDFAMIHDSFGTHAATTPLLFEVLRDKFAEMYQADVLDDLYKSMPEAVQEKLEKPPKRGFLDLSLVKESEFFFA